MPFSGWCMRLRFSHALLDLAKSLSQWMLFKPGAYKKYAYYFTSFDRMAWISQSHQYLRLGDRVCENALGRSCWHRNYIRSCWFVKCAIFLVAINQTFLARTPSLSLWCRRLGLVNSWGVSVHVVVFGFPCFLKQVLEDAKPFPRVPLQMAGKHDCPVVIGDFRFFRSVGKQLRSIFFGIPQEAIIPFWGASNPTIAKDCSDKNAYKDQIRGGAVEVFLWRTEGGHGKTKIGCSHSKCWQDGRCCPGRAIYAFFHGYIHKFLLVTILSWLVLRPPCSLCLAYKVLQKNTCFLGWFLNRHLDGT